MGACDVDMILSNPGERNNRSFAKHFRKLVMFERDCLILASIGLFEAIVEIATFLASFVVNMEKHFSCLQQMWQKALRILAIFSIEGVKYSDREANDKGEKNDHN